MTKAEALAFFGGDIRKCAEALKISTQAIYDWRAEEIPELRRFQLMEICNGDERSNGKSASGSIGTLSSDARRNKSGRDRARNRFAAQERETGK